MTLVYAAPENTGAEPMQDVQPSGAAANTSENAVTAAADEEEAALIAAGHEAMDATTNATGTAQLPEGTPPSITPPSGPPPSLPNAPPPVPPPAAAPAAAAAAAAPESAAGQVLVADEEGPIKASPFRGVTPGTQIRCFMSCC
jgi:hypothetical protein